MAGLARRLHAGERWKVLRVGGAKQQTQCVEDTWAAAACHIQSTARVARRSNQHPLPADNTALGTCGGIQCSMCVCVHVCVCVCAESPARFVPISVP